MPQQKDLKQPNKEIINFLKKKRCKKKEEKIKKKTSVFF